MALHHAAPGEVIALHRPHGAAAERNVALFKARDLEVLRLVLAQGESLPPHRVGGDITVQCLAGVLEVGMPAYRVRLHVGELVYVPGEVAYDLLAVQDATALVTIALRSDGIEGPAYGQNCSHITARRSRAGGNPVTFEASRRTPACAGGDAPA